MLRSGLDRSMASVCFVFPSHSGQGYNFYPQKLWRLSSLQLFFLIFFLIFFFFFKALSLAIKVQKGNRRKEP